MQEKFSALSNFESNGWSLPLADEEVVSAKMTSKAMLVIKGNSRPRSAAPSEGLKDLIVQRRKKMLTVKIPEVHIENNDKIESMAAMLSPVPLKTFDGGFFTLSSPAARLQGGSRIHCQTVRSVGRKAPVTR